MRLPVQLWKYSWATTLSMASKIVSVAVSGEARIEPVVEDVETLVLHRAHVEVGDGDDVEHVEVVLAPEALLVPPHRALERVHRPGGALLLAVLDVDGEVDLAPRHGAEGGADRGEVAADEGEQVAGLGMRVVPHGIVALAAVEHAALLQVAVGEQDGCRLRVGIDAHRIGGEHVGAVEEVRDAAEALRLALARVDVAAAVDALQRLVGLRD